MHKAGFGDLVPELSQDIILECDVVIIDIVYRSRALDLIQLKFVVAEVPQNIDAAE